MLFIERLIDQDYNDFADSCKIRILEKNKDFTNGSYIVKAEYNSSKMEVTLILSDYNCEVDSEDFEEKNMFFNKWIDTMLIACKEEYKNQITHNSKDNFKLKTYIEKFIDNENQNFIIPKTIRSKDISLNF